MRLTVLRPGIIVTFIVFTSTLTANGQTSADALRFSRNFYPTNARSAGVANAFGALGANSIAPSINPAGLGLYRQSEFSISPTFALVNSSTQYLGESQDAIKPNFNFGNIGLTFNEIKTTEGGNRKTSGWISNTFVIGMNRQAGYHLRSYAKGVNKNSSILEAFRDRANERQAYPGELTDNSIAGLAFKNWLINLFYPDSSNYYTSTEPGRTPDVQQEQNLTTSGSKSDIYVAYGTNYSDKLYIGGSIGIPIVSYEQERTFSEENRQFASADLNDSIPNFKNMSFTEEFSTNGAGVFGSFGLIYRPFHFLRVGASIYTPTYYALEDVYQYKMSANVKDLGSSPNNYNDELSSDEFTFSYNMVTPFRALANAAFIIRERGFISLDYEYKDFSSAQISSDDFIFSSVNDNIQQLYKPAHKIKLGAEYKAGIFSVRAGYGYFSSPFKSGYVPDDANSAGNLYSLGLGIDNGTYTYNLAYQLRQSTRFSTPYQLGNKTDPGIVREISQNQVIFSFNVHW